MSQTNEMFKKGFDEAVRVLKTIAENSGNPQQWIRELAEAAERIKQEAEGGENRNKKEG